MTRPEVLALIPARGGSKGIPRKNLLMLDGRPLLDYSIAVAQQSRCVTRIVVSTDDEEIAAVARRLGAEVPGLRPAALATDDSPDIDTFRHTLETLGVRDGYRCDCVVHLRPTGPLRRVETVDAAIQLLLLRPDVDSVRSVSVPPVSPYKMWGETDGLLRPLLSVPGIAEPHSGPRQALPVVYWQNGYVDVIRPAVILEHGMMAGKRVLPFMITEPILELDDPEDVTRVEAALARRRQGLPDDIHHGRRHPV